MIDDQEDDQFESEYLPPVAKYEFDMLPEDVKQIYRNILAYRADPTAQCQDITVETIAQQLRDLVQDQVVAIDSEENMIKYKEKGQMFDPVLQSFVQGSGGRLGYWEQEQHGCTPVVMRGITKHKYMQACREAGRDFYYVDTGYFGNGQAKLYHRITKNDVQNFGPIVERPRDRLRATGIRLRKFTSGSSILLAPPSQKLLKNYGIDLEQWLEHTVTTIKQYSDRPIVIRPKQIRKLRQSTDTIESALDQDVHCLVTFSSIAAGEALLYGKPAITLGPNAAAPLCSQSLSEIENPRIPTLDEVEQWAAHLAYCQFSVGEMRDGTAWRILNDH